MIKTFFLKKYNKRQKYLLLLNLIAIFFLIYLNLNTELIFLKLPFQDASADFWDNFLASIILISLPYFLLYEGLNLGFRFGGIVSFFVYLWLVIYYQTLKDFFRIDLIILIPAFLLIYFFLLYILRYLSKEGVLSKISNIFQINDSQFQVFEFKKDWIKFYIITFKKNINNDNDDKTNSSVKTYFFIITENQYNHILNEVNLFKNEIIVIKNYQIEDNYYYDFNKNDFISLIDDSIQKIFRFHDYDKEEFGNDYSFYKIKLNCIIIKSKILNNKKIISFNVNLKCKNCSIDKQCFEFDFFEVEYDEFKKFIL